MWISLSIFKAFDTWEDERYLYVNWEDFVTKENPYLACITFRVQSALEFMNIIEHDRHGCEIFRLLTVKSVLRLVFKGNQV